MLFLPLRTHDALIFPLVAWEFTFRYTPSPMCFQIASSLSQRSQLADTFTSYFLCTCFLANVALLIKYYNRKVKQNLFPHFVILPTRTKNYNPVHPSSRPCSDSFHPYSDSHFTQPTKETTINSIRETKQDLSYHTNKQEIILKTHIPEKINPNRRHST